MTKRIKGASAYRIRYDHIIGHTNVLYPQNKEEALIWIHRDLGKFPHIKASLQKSKIPFGTDWKAVGTYMYRLSRKTHRHRLVKL